MDTILRKCTFSDVDAIHSLYRKVASVEGGLARKKDEVTTEYVSSFVEKSLQKGVIFVAMEKPTSKVIGEIHCYSPGIQVFAHVLSDLTIAVDPDFQGQGIGRKLFEQLLATIINEKQEILRVELLARESNGKAIRFYQSLGFKIEGRFEKRIKSVGGGFEADLPMAWSRQ